MLTPKLSPAVFFVAFGLFLVSAAVSYQVFSYVDTHRAEPLISEDAPGRAKNKQKVKPDLPRTEECPINGMMLTKPEREAWEKRRPLGVMIDNSRPARPQSGISFADVVYEAVAEGGITRFLGIYYCQDAEYAGPVRSARTYYLDWLSEYGRSPLYAHVGGANTPGPANALGQIQQYGWGFYNDLDNFSVGVPAYILDTDRITKDTAIEHSKYAVPEKLWEFAASKRDLTNLETDAKTGEEKSWDEEFEKWSFKDDIPVESRPNAFSAEFNFSGIQASYLGDYSTLWRYDRDSNSFLRLTGGSEHRDLNTGQQVLAKNIIIQFMTMTVADDGYSEEGHGSHTLYETKGTGKAIFLIDGKKTSGTWAKGTRLSRTQFFDDKGLEVKLNRGQTWIEILPIGQEIKFE